MAHNKINSHEFSDTIAADAWQQLQANEASCAVIIVQAFEEKIKEVYIFQFLNGISNKAQVYLKKLDSFLHNRAFSIKPIIESSYLFNLLQKVAGKKKLYIMVEREYRRKELRSTESRRANTFIKERTTQFCLGKLITNPLFNTHYIDKPQPVLPRKVSKPKYTPSDICTIYKLDKKVRIVNKVKCHSIIE